MSKFLVAFDESNRRALILNDGDENVPAEYEILGSFEFDTSSGIIQGENGEHPYVFEAKKLLEDEGFTDINSVRFEDRASNQPNPDNSELTIKEVEQRNASRLRGTPATGENPEITRAGKPAEALVEEDENLTVPDKEVASESPAVPSEGEEQKPDATQKAAPAKSKSKPKT